MSDVIIRAEALSKRYRLGRQEQYRALRDRLGDGLAAPLRLARAALRPGPRPAAPPDAAELWALRDVSFEVRQGEVVGIIGRNGAGKSTLLKILSKITRPTSGRVGVRGRVGSLLEVGTGFHPELTGRENIFLNGAILGMRRDEIVRKFDEIVAFAEVERFIDTPVKHYSSGMYMRLAFAVAAHLEPEILVVDEVLAVGDAEFQKKCIGKMGEVSRHGRTVLFVSHNLNAIAALCGRCIHLREGYVQEIGPTARVIPSYQIASQDLRSTERDLTGLPRTGSGKAKFTVCRHYGVAHDGTRTELIHTGQDIVIELEITAAQKMANANTAVIISDSVGYRIIDANTALRGAWLSLQSGDQAVVRFLLQNVLLKPGLYNLSLWLGHGGVEEIDSIEQAAVLSVEEDASTVMHTEKFPGIYLCKFEHHIAIHTPETK